MTLSIMRGAALLSLAGIALASAEAQPSSCAGTTQAELNRCANEAAKSADAALNDTYRRLIANVSPASAARLKSAQRAWVGFRNAECTFLSNGKDAGSAGPMVAANCVTQLTRLRTAQLAETASCPEGDIACPR